MANIYSEILSAQYKAEYSTPNNIPEFVGNIPVGLPIVETELAETLIPINPVTGHRDSDLSRLFDPTISPTEKEFIMSQLKEMKGKSSPQGLTDDELISMIPSRHMSDPVEIERYLDDLKEYRDGLLTPEEPDLIDPDPSDPQPTQPTD